MYFTMQPSRTDHHGEIDYHLTYLFFGYGVSIITETILELPSNRSMVSVDRFGTLLHALLVGVANEERAFLFRCALRVDKRERKFHTSMS